MIQDKLYTDKIVEWTNDFGPEDLPRIDKKYVHKVDEINKVLWDEAISAPEDFIRMTFELALPEVKAMDFSEIRESFMREAEVLRSL